MTFREISDQFHGIADELKLNWGFAPFRHGKEPKPPYIAFSYPERNDFGADNKPYVRISRIVVLLVTKNKDIGLEEAIEAEFASLEINYSKESDFYQDEDVYVSTYETEELIDGND